MKQRITRLRNETRLRGMLILSFLVIAIPLGLFTLKARQQIKWEALYQQRALAEELSQRIDQSLQTLIAREDARAVADYQFFNAAAQANRYWQRSPLSEWPPADAPPGLLGYFQVDGKGQLQSPVLPDQQDPARWGLTDADLTQRQQLMANLRDILTHNALVPRAPLAKKSTAREMSDKEQPGRASESSYDAAGMSSAENPQESFDRLNTSQKQLQQKSLGKISDLKLEEDLSKAKRDEPLAPRPALQAPASAVSTERRVSRKEQVASPAPLPSVEQSARENRVEVVTPVLMFASEIEPFEWIRLDSGHLLFYRKVWRSGERLVQGFVLNENQFFDAMVGRFFESSALASACHLVLAYRGDILKIFAGNAVSSDDHSLASQARDIRGTLALQQRLSSPLSDLQLIFSVVDLSGGPGSAYINGIAIVIFVLLLTVFIGLYRLGLKQLLLARQQQDFIASVSHELKTPLTSIRMFGEILREGWASPAKQKEYYDFICDESERLTRLIGNVLQLARMERQDTQLELKAQPLPVLCDLLRSRVQSLIDRSGFELAFVAPGIDQNRQLLVDTDALIQIVLNLVDNGIKFSRSAVQKKIELHVKADEERVSFVVRDFGPGIAPSQQSKIFDLFYRIGDELTRETQGTGIGLALVKQLAQGMSGTVSVRNVQPGAEFVLSLPYLPN